MVHRSLHPTVGRHWSQPELRLPRVDPLLRPPSAQIDPKNGFVVSHSCSPAFFPLCFVHRRCRNTAAAAAVAATAATAARRGPCPRGPAPCCRAPRPRPAVLDVALPHPAAAALCRRRNAALPCLAPPRAPPPAPPRGRPCSALRRPRREALAAAGPGPAAGGPAGVTPLRRPERWPRVRAKQRRGAGSWAPTDVWGPAVSPPFNIFFVICFG